MNFLSQILLSIGCLFIFLAAVGSIKFPDTLTRMAAVSKSSTMGLALICLAGMIEFGFSEASVQLLFSLFFTFISFPMVSYLLGRLRVYSRTSLSQLTHRNDFEKQVQQTQKTNRTSSEFSL
ncbi:MAG: monovalent cation/H(+) antiporter subunit G [Bdellovibrio sp.]